MNTKIPKIKLNAKIYGVDMNIVRKYLNGSETTCVTFKFFLKREGILKRWEKIKDLLTDIEGSQLEVVRHRSFSYFKVNEVGPLKPHARYWCLRHYAPKMENLSEGNSTKSNVTLGNPDYLKREVKTGNYKVNETLEITKTIPLSPSLCFEAEFQKVFKLRNFIISFNSLIKGNDKLNALNGKPQTPEYNESKLNHMKAMGNHEYFSRTTSTTYVPNTYSGISSLGITLDDDIPF